MRSDRPPAAATGAGVLPSGHVRVDLSYLPSVRGAMSSWRLSWPLIIGTLMFVALLNVTGVPLLADPDSHWHIAVGKWILENGAVPTIDSYSHTFSGHAWIAKEWLSQVLLALAYGAGGWGAVAALCAASIGLSFALMLRLLLRDIGPLPATLFTIAAVVMTVSHLLARPHVLAFPVMLLWVAGLVRAVEQRRAPRPLLLVAMLLWANLHGGFTLGLMLCGAFALEAMVTAGDSTERRRLFIAWAKFGMAAVLVACVTPYGPESMLVTLRIFGLGDVLGMISEWKSPDFQSQPFQELILLLALYAALSRGLKLPIIRLVVTLGLLHLFLKHARNAELLVMLTPLVLAPVLARQWPSMRPDRGSLPGPAFLRRMTVRGRSVGRLGALLCLPLAALFAAGMIKFGGIRPAADTTPVAAFDFIRETKIQGPVFNAYEFGGFLIEVGIPTFIDGRAELFGGDFTKRYARAVNLSSEEPLEQLLDHYGIEWTFLRKDQPANRLLERLPGWRRAYSDDVATIFVRKQ
jgi:hypothetical protein